MQRSGDLRGRRGRRAAPVRRRGGRQSRNASQPCQEIAARQHRQTQAHWRRIPCQPDAARTRSDQVRVEASDFTEPGSPSSSARDSRRSAARRCRVGERLRVERGRHLDLLHLVAAIAARQVAVQLHDRLDDLPGLGQFALAHEGQRDARRDASLLARVGARIEDPAFLGRERRPRAPLGGLVILQGNFSLRLHVIREKGGRVLPLDVVLVLRLHRLEPRIHVRADVAGRSRVAAGKRKTRFRPKLQQLGKGYREAARRFDLLQRRQVRFQFLDDVARLVEIARRRHCARQCATRSETAPFATRCPPRRISARWRRVVSSISSASST